MTDRERLVEILLGGHFPINEGNVTVGEYRMDNMFAERIANHLVENGATFSKIGQWNLYVAEDGWEHHCCSECGEDAMFTVLYEADYDEDLDGEMRYCGDREYGIAESLTQCCPHCGVKMRGVEE